jgi:hypothetical protein
MTWLSNLLRGRTPAPPAPAPEPEPNAAAIEQILAAPVISAGPLSIGAPVDPVAYANARIGHIGRHIQQHGASDAKTTEFQTEMFSLLHTLRQHNAVTPEDERNALVMVGIMGSAI